MRQLLFYRCAREGSTDWMRHLHHPLLLLETFVDPQHFHGTIHRAANWIILGSTKGFRLASAQGYQPNASPKLVFVYALQRNAQRLLSQSYLNPVYQCGIPKLMLTASQMNALPTLFKSIQDPRRTQGRRHRLETILAITTGAILCGRVGYKGIAKWAQSLGQDARARFQCYYKQERYHAPSEYIIRDTLIKVEPDISPSKPINPGYLKICSITLNIVRHLMPRKKLWARAYRNP